MSKSSTSAPMKRRQLRNKYVKNGSESNRLAFSKQCNYCVNFSRKNKRDYFANLENFVKHWRMTGTGIKPGCNINPNLFNLFINYIKSIFDETYCQPVWIGSIAINCLCYVVDVVIMSETSWGSQNSLDRLQSYCEKWKLAVNNKEQKFSCLWEKAISLPYVRLLP